MYGLEALGSFLLSHSLLSTAGVAASTGIVFLSFSFSFWNFLFLKMLVTVCYWNISAFPLSSTAQTAFQLFSSYSTEWPTLVIGTLPVHYVHLNHQYLSGSQGIVVSLSISRYQIIKRQQWIKVLGPGTQRRWIQRQSTIPSLQSTSLWILLSLHWESISVSTEN